MYVRKLFREPGPPRPSPLRQGSWPAEHDERMISQGRREIILPPTSSQPPDASLQQQSSSLLAANSNWADKGDNSSYLQKYPGERGFRDYSVQEHDDSVYPGLHYHSPLDDDRLKIQAKELSRSAENQFASAAKGHRGLKTWRALFPRHGQLAGQPSRGLELLPASSLVGQFVHPSVNEGKVDVNERNPVKRAFEAFRQKRFFHRRSSSFDINFLVPDRHSYLPDQASLQQRAKMTRHSLDSQLPSMADHFHGPENPHFDAQPAFELSGSNQAWHPQITYPMIGLRREVRSMLLESQQSQNHIHEQQVQGDRMCKPAAFPDVKTSAGSQRHEHKPPPDTSAQDSAVVFQGEPSGCMLAATSRKSAHGNAGNEWNLVRRKAIRKYEDWIQQSPPPDGESPVKAEDRKLQERDEAPVLAPTPMHASKSSLDTEALHTRLNQFLREEEKLMMTRERKHPATLSIVKGKHDEKNPEQTVRSSPEGKNLLKRLYNPQLLPLRIEFPLNEGRTEVNSANQEGTREDEHAKLGDDLQPKQSLARKMFVDVATGISGLDCPSKVANEGMSTTHQRNRVTGAGPSEQGGCNSTIEEPLPILKRTADDSSGREGAQQLSIPPLLLVNAGQWPNASSCDWGSLGPPSEDAFGLRKLSNNGNTPDARRLGNTLCIDGALPERGRSSDLEVHPVSIPLSDADSAECSHSVRSIAIAEYEAAHRIQSWLARTEATPQRVLYAPSATATEPSAYCRVRRCKKRSGEADSHITSISRRGVVGRQSGVRKESLSQEYNVDVGKSYDSTILATKRAADDQLESMHAVNEQCFTLAYPSQQEGGGKLLNARKVDAISPTGSTSLGVGTRHLRQLKPEESAMLRNVLYDGIGEAPQLCTPPVPLAPTDLPSPFELSPSKMKERKEPIPKQNAPSQTREDWESLIVSLAAVLNEDVESAVEALLKRYSKDIRLFYKTHPEMLLMVSLRAKLQKMEERDDRSTLTSDTAKPVVPSECGSSHTSTPSSMRLSSQQRADSLLAGDVGIERALQKIVEYITNAGEISQLQKSLLVLHRHMLDCDQDTRTICMRLNQLEEVVYSQRPL